jgi:hypothetical protein
MTNESSSSKAIKTLNNLYKSNKIGIVHCENQKEQIMNQTNSIFDDGSTRTKDLIACLRDHTLGKTVSKRFLCTKCSHYSSGYVDRDYGCGYRNTQMLLSSIREDDELKHVLFNNNQTVIPSIYKIQDLIESAWSKGFDLMGKEQLNGCLKNTSKWIGSSDIAAMFLSLRVRVELIDIQSKTTPSASQILFKFVKEYFEKEQQQNGDFVHPIYLQHQGHSRTIVGYETSQKTSGVSQQNDCLLIFDPSTKKSQIDANMKLSIKFMSLFRRSQLTFKKNEYQLLVIRGLIESEHEYQVKIE